MNAICTILTDYYMDYFASFINSILLNSSNLLEKNDLVIITNNKEIKDVPEYVYTCNCEPRISCTHQTRLNFTLSEFNRERIKKIIPNVKFLDIDVDLFLSRKKISPHYWSVMCFSLYEYDKVLSMDSDMLVLSDISDLFSLDCNFGICKIKGFSNVYDLNGGLFLIGKNYLNKEMFEFLLNDSADLEKAVGPQESYKRLALKGFYDIGEIYNSGVPGTYFENISKVKILHYMYKPNTVFSSDKIDPRFTEFWLKYFKGAM